MASAVLTKFESPLETLTRPDPSPEPQKLLIGSGYNGGTISVIENPRLENCLGLLFARHLDQAQWTDLRDVSYFRIEGEDNLKQDAQFQKIRLNRGLISLRDPFSSYYYAITEDGKVLPNPSSIPYQVCPVEPATFTYYENGIRDAAKNRALKFMMQSLYGFLMKTAKDFRLADEKLVLPPNYAELRL